jgi:DNA-binding LacI/PurR family transcriptional regulator
LASTASKRATSTPPALSTVRPDKAEIARLAVDFLERRIAVGEASSQEGYAPFELLVRRSTQPAGQ